MKFLSSIMLGAVLIVAPVAANAQSHGGGGHGGGGFHGGGFGGGGFHGGGFHGGGFRGGGYRGGGYHGGGYYHGGWGGYRGGWGGYRGGYGWGGGYPFFYGAGLGFGLGFYDDPWAWGYPGYYYDAPAEPPPVSDYGYSQAPYNGGSVQSAPQACGSWQWGQDRQYHWVTNGCN